MREHRHQARTAVPPATSNVPVVSIGIGARIRQLSRRTKASVCSGCRATGIVGFCRECVESRALDDLGGEG